VHLAGRPLGYREQQRGVKDGVIVSELMVAAGEPDK
jgi:hypothetical protein